MSLWIGGRRVLAITLGVGGVLVGGAIVAVAEPPTPVPTPTPAPAPAPPADGAPSAPAPAPADCTAANLAQVSSGVTAATSAYLFSHPDVNGFFTGLKGLPKEELRARVEQYADANPQVKADLQGIRQPMVDFRNRCG